MVVSYIQVEPNLQCDKNYANFIDISKRMDASNNNESEDFHSGTYQFVRLKKKL